MLNVRQYLKENYVSFEGRSISEEELNNYAEICSECKHKREVDEMVVFQQYYKVNLPIVKN